MASSKAGERRFDRRSLCLPENSTLDEVEHDVLHALQDRSVGLGSGGKRRMDEQRTQACADATATSTATVTATVRDFLASGVLREFPGGYMQVAERCSCRAYDLKLPGQEGSHWVGLSNPTHPEYDTAAGGSGEGITLTKSSSDELLVEVMRTRRRSVPKTLIDRFLARFDKFTLDTPALVMSMDRKLAKQILGGRIRGWIDNGNDPTVIAACIDLFWDTYTPRPGRDPVKSFVASITSLSAAVDRKTADKGHKLWEDN